MTHVVELRGRDGFHAMTAEAGNKSDLTVTDPDRYYFRMESCEIGVVKANRIQMSSCRTAPGKVEDDDVVNLFLIMNGAMTVEAGRRRWTFRSGQVAAQVGWNRYQGTNETLVDQLLLRIDHHALVDRGLVIAPDVVHFGPTRATTTTHGLSSLVKAVMYGQSVTGTPVTTAVENALLELIVGLHHEGLGYAGTSGELDLGLHARAMTAIRAGYRDAELTPTGLADVLGVNLRQLQRAFEKAGCTIARELRSRRAEHAAALLRDRRAQSMTLDEIAAAAGFTTSGELRRSIRASYGATPTQLRDTPAV